MSIAIARLKKELRRLRKEPVEHIEALPLESNIFEWHFVLEGPPNTPYEGGIYHGVIVFPPAYPYKAPSLRMMTPSGRFKTNTPLCTSFTDFHNESWSAAWSCRSILLGFLSFMLEDKPTYGSIETTEAEKRRLARHSLEFCCRDTTFVELFPHHVQRLKEQKAARAAAASAADDDDDYDGIRNRNRKRVGSAAGAASPSGMGSKAGDGNGAGAGGVVRLVKNTSLLEAGLLTLVVVAVCAGLGFLYT